MDAIAYYGANGLDATVEYYNSRRSHEGERALFLVNEDSLLSVAPFAALVGTPLGLGTGAFPAREEITEEGIWANLLGFNPATGAQSPMRAIFILHDGLIFASGHFPVRENVEEATQDYVSRAIKLYQRDGLEATVGYYNSRASMEGQLYLFLIDANDEYVAHPIFPHLIGTDIKDVIGSDGQELGKEIAQATEEGIWVEYLWPHPVSGKEGEKVTWAIRHDGLIFASGYYAGRDIEDGTPPWHDVEDPREYTVDYVNRAVERYRQDGLESVLNHYNSVASFEGEWYLFVTDAEDIYIVHALFPRFKGTDLKDVVSSDGYELGKALAAAQDGGEGVWVEYLWPHPVTLKEVPKVGYAVRRDGMIFASGYYPETEDPAAYTQEYVADAIDYYKANGLEATIAHYNSRESVDGQWWLTLIDENYLYVADIYFPNLIGTDGRDRTSPVGSDDGAMLTTATERGTWHSTPWFNPNTSENLRRNLWVVRHDGLIFISSYFTAAGEPGPEESADDDAVTRAYVHQAIDYYDTNGLDTTVGFYNSGASVENGRVLLLVDTRDNNRVLAFSTFPLMVGINTTASIVLPSIGVTIANATAEGAWSSGTGINRATRGTEPHRFFAVRHQDGLVFIASHSTLVENVEDAITGYVGRAIQYYADNGLDATIAHYDSEESLEGQLYLFLIGADDLYLAHPIFPHLKGTDIKDVVGSDGQELGKKIAQATERGIWVEYLWPHPVTGEELPKVTWAVRHDGLIFGSGYYTGGSEVGPPPWTNVADPRQYTEDYVERAIAHYQQHGLESLKDYYNSVAGYEGQWYLFATDANDIYIVHPLLPGLIGTDIKDVVGMDGFELGKELAAAEDGGEGVWVEYLWPHPATVEEVVKWGYAKRYDGLLFASGYYQAEDLAAQTKAYVQEAIEYYDVNGLEAAVAKYADRASIGGHWSAIIVDENGIVRVMTLFPSLVGGPLSLLSGTVGRDLSGPILAATEAGSWVRFRFALGGTSEAEYHHMWVVRRDGRIFGVMYTDAQPGSPEPEPVDEDDALTRAYVEKAIAYYTANGLDATAAQYRSDAGVEDGRSLVLIDGEGVLQVYRTIPSLVGQYVGAGSRFPGLAQLIGVATEEGRWINGRGVNQVTKQEEPRRMLVVLHDGLVFISSHSALTEDVASSTKEYVAKAIARYESDGLGATIAYYNSQDSLDGQFYLFLIGADDNYLAHPIFPHLIGTDIKDVVGSDGQELGNEIAEATEQGIWVEYLWPHPVSRREQQKVTWAMRHDGMIFASGYYAGAPEAGTPAWQDADPREYTVDYVNRAIERYERDGLQSMIDYYNSVASFEGEWYLFATDANDIYHVHPLIPPLRGTDIKDVVGSDGYELGKALAAAVDGGEGVWVEYLWPHPVTLKEVPKVGYAVRRDGMIFASGYYPQVEDPAAATQAYVQEAIDYYKANGLDATVAYYNSQDSVDGQWSLTMADENDIVVVAFLGQRLIGTDLKEFARGRLRQIGEELAAATTEGVWVSHIFPNTRSSETLYAHNWAIRYEGLLFVSRYYDDRPGVGG